MYRYNRSEEIERADCRRAMVPLQERFLQKSREHAPERTTRF